MLCENKNANYTLRSGMFKASERLFFPYSNVATPAAVLCYPKNSEPKGETFVSGSRN
jgi:hypothetical protein